jgi:hypothetical protein
MSSEYIINFESETKANVFFDLLSKNIKKTNPKKVGLFTIEPEGNNSSWEHDYLFEKIEQTKVYVDIVMPNKNTNKIIQNILSSMQTKITEADDQEPIPTAEVFQT